MRIVVNHLTRLRHGDICAAGIDEATGRHVRPVFGVLRPRLLIRNGGFLDMACLVDLGRVRRVGSPPEVEDHQFRPKRARFLAPVEPDRFRKLLEEVARDSVEEIFGDEIAPIGRRGAWGVEKGRGKASLGCLRVSSACRLYLQRRPGRSNRLRIAFRRHGQSYDLGVTDIRLFAADHMTPDAQAIARAARQLSRGGSAILSVGLTRPFSPSDDYPPKHWLQANNIHLPDDLCWRLG